jgi:hypothetical protein
LLDTSQSGASRVDFFGDVVEAVAAVAYQLAAFSLCCAIARPS